MDASPTSAKLPCLYWWHTVLVVDDEPAALRAVARSLHREPYDLVVVDGPRAALALLLQKDVSLVVADRRMPEMEGDRLLQEVWKRSPTTVGVILSGWPGEDAPEAVDIRLRGLLRKPWDDQDLKRTIRTLLAERERDLARRVRR
jgi:DNA-binding NtrC family response regulator